METSILIAKLFGPIYALIGLAILCNSKFYQGVFSDFGKNSALYYVVSIMPLLIGLLIVQNHNTWEANWTVVITLLGWAALLKGVGLLLFPKFHINMIEKMCKNTCTLQAGGIFALVVGAYLSYMAFM